MLENTDKRNETVGMAGTEKSYFSEIGEYRTATRESAMAAAGVSDLPEGVVPYLGLLHQYGQCRDAVIYLTGNEGVNRMPKRTEIIKLLSSLDKEAREALLKIKDPVLLIIPPLSTSDIIQKIQTTPAEYKCLHVNDSIDNEYVRYQDHSEYEVCVVDGAGRTGRKSGFKKLRNEAVNKSAEIREQNLRPIEEREYIVFMLQKVMSAGQGEFDESLCGFVGTPDLKTFSVLDSGDVNSESRSVRIGYNYGGVMEMQEQTEASHDPGLGIPVYRPVLQLKK